MKVTIKDIKSGKEKTMDKRYADVLVKIGKHEYLTTNMPDFPILQAETKIQFVADEKSDLDELDQSKLHSLAKQIGLKLHHLTGAEKVREAIKAHRAKAK